MKKPKIPMLPDELPRQHLYEVTQNPERPASVEFFIGLRNIPEGALPKKPPQSADYLCQAEWSPRPGYVRLDAYYLHRGRKHWVLWRRSWDDEWNEWNWDALGCVRRAGVSWEQAATYLILEYWKAEECENRIGRFDWVNEEGLLEISDINAIAREVWG